jgi:hypothetical protein
MSRLWLVVVALFWGAMNFLLWRAEYGDSATLGSSLPVSVVWEKILETPDASGLEIRQRGEKIGFCRWSVIQENPLEDEASFEESLGQDELDGMIENILGYQIQLEGNLSTGSDAGRYLRFGFSTHLKADAQTWTESDLRIGKKGNWLQLATENGSEALKVQHTYEGTHSELSFSFDDLKNPGALLQGLGLPMPWIGLPMMAGLPNFNLSDLSLGIKWEAGTEFVTVAHTRVRVYYLRARLFDDQKVSLMISRAGEILKAELPNDILLVNDSFTGI